MVSDHGRSKNARAIEQQAIDNSNALVEKMITDRNLNDSILRDQRALTREINQNKDFRSLQ